LLFIISGKTKKKLEDIFEEIPNIGL